MGPAHGRGIWHRAAHTLDSGFMLSSRFWRVALLGAVVPLLGVIPNRQTHAAAPASPRSGPASTPTVTQSLATNVLVATIAASEGDNAEAARTFTRAAQLAPSYRPFIERAFLYSILAGSPDAARLARQQPPGVVPELVMGNAAAVASDWAGALEHYEKAPDDPIMTIVRPLLRAWALQGMGRTDDALAALARAQGDRLLGGYYTLHAALIAEMGGQAMRADTLYRRALDMSGGDLFTTRVLTHWLYQQGKAAQARDMIAAKIASMAALEPARPALVAALGRPVVTTPQQGMAQAYGLLALLMDQQSAAETPPPKPGEGHREHEHDITTLRSTEQMMLRLSLMLDPANTEARILLSALFHAEDENQQAIDVLAEVAPTDPMAVVIRAEEGELDMTLGRRAEAERIIRGLLRDAPTDRTLWCDMGDIMLGQGKWREALSAYTHALALSGTLEGDDWRVLFGQSIAYDRLGDWKHAKAGLTQALRMAPNEAELLNDLGYSMVEHGDDPATAEGYLRRALALSPDDGQIRDSVGWIELRLGHVAEGLPLLERAAEQMPQDPAINYHLGVAYWVSGRRLEAVDAWQDAAQFHPDPPDQRKIAAALAYAASQAAAHPPAHATIPADLRIMPVAAPAPVAASPAAAGTAASPNPKTTGPDRPDGDTKDGAHK
ncbi:Tetratricopeptide repeat protein [Novacetimonas maltaceti]|uniref:Tetratricopeptide repeat protein n=2 Tax=Novacetimonas maltaceti TaxID=1203393 RepID=A0A2S3W3B5_9PROT|nr:Tetratricopeptide repeat protein [Novacetimonas maltaceti]